MAIIRTKETSKTVLDKAPTAPKLETEKISNVKKSGFFRSVYQELKLVQWPTWRHTANWALTVVVFSLVLTVFIGGLDKVFKNGFEYATCTANFYKGAGGSNYEQCARQLGQSLITFN